MYLLFDIGGTSTRISTSLDGKTLAETKIIPTDKYFEQAAQSITEITEQLTKGQQIEMAAGGVAGILDKDKSLLTKSPHLEGWVFRPVKEKLEEIFNCPVFLENDAHLGGLGEANFGAGKNHQIVAFVTIGTGVGGVRIVDQKIDRNSQGFEVGHQIILPDGPPCDCGGKGHLETFVAGSYLERTHQQKPDQITDESIWIEAAKYLGIGLNNVIVHWSPDIVVLGGSIIKKIPLDKLQLNVLDNLKIFSVKPKITLAVLGDKAGLFGALKLIT